MIDEMVGETPVVQLLRVGGGAVRLKLETRSPNATVMDRVARHLVKDRPPAPWREAGDPALCVALAMQGALHGVPVEVTLPADVPLEVRQTLMTYGAQATLAPMGAPMPTDTLRAKFPGALAAALAEIGAELRRTEERIDAFVGPPGVLIGVPCFDVGPAATPNRQHGHFGGSAEIVDDATAWKMRERLGREEGLLLSAASAAHVVAACRVAERLGPGARVYALAFDTGERSFSTAEQLP